MKMHRTRGWAVLLAILTLCSTRQAAAASTYALECNANVQGRITVQLSSFRVQVGLPGGPATVNRQRPFELTAHFPAGRAYSAFQEAMERNELIHNCKLTETESSGPSGFRPSGAAGGATASTLEWTFTDGGLTSVAAVGSDGTSPTGNVTPQGSMQIVLTFQNMAFAARP